MDSIYRQPTPDNRINSMSIASMVLGITSIVTCTCVYLSVICGALAIILASLSRGGRMKYDSFANTGRILGIVGLSLALFFFVYSLFVILTDPTYMKQLEEMLREYCETYGYDFDELYGGFFSSQQ